MRKAWPWLLGVLVILGAGRLCAAEQSAPDADFAARCSAPGVIKCVGFDDNSAIAGRWGDRSGVVNSSSSTALPTIDYSMKASGAGSLRLDVPAQAGPSPAGNYFTNFSDDTSVQFGENSQFFIQFRQRMTLSFIDQPSPSRKQIIIAAGDLAGCSREHSLSLPSGGDCAGACSANEIVLIASYLGFPTMYDSCTKTESHGPYDGFESHGYLADGTYIGADWVYENAMPNPYCLRSQRTDLGGKGPLPPNGGCWAYKPAQWMTFQVEVKTGPLVNREYKNSYVRLWAAYEGEPSQLVIDWGPYNLAATDEGGSAPLQKFGKVWLMAYQTGRDPDFVGEQAVTWFDELIISKNRIADPGMTVAYPVQPTPPQLTIKE